MINMTNSDDLEGVSAEYSVRCATQHPRSEVRSPAVVVMYALSQEVCSVVTERAKGCELGFLRLNSGNATAIDPT
jgi:hypothetical protein